VAQESEENLKKGKLNSMKQIDRNCNVLPLLKFCTNKPILASLLRQIFFGGGGRGRFAQKMGVTHLLRAITDL
jgi:hypothetical protein